MEGSEEQKIPSDHENVNFRNQDPAFFTDVVGGVGGFFAAYGWILLAVAIVMWYASKKLSGVFNRQLASHQSRVQYSSVDPDRAFQQAEAMERVRRRMQEELDAKAARYIEEQKIKDEEKRKQQIEEWEKHREGKGYKSKYKPQESQPSTSTASASKPSTVPSTSSGPRRNVYRSNDFNPLNGSSGGSSYRPSPRCGPSSGGG